MDLEVIRQNIDKIDKELVTLIEKRMNLVSQVAAYKKETGQPIYDQAREEAILDKVAGLVQNKGLEPFIRATFTDIMKESRAYQAQELS
ncbi:chorismate mutase [Streptococcus criceti]|uniref:Chorismate mutase n=1 Tax=Streptococcus criceti HS-6 TaxID=873449 RepID=G5JR73_STRCG|nr:chorismate mutase [Streptococcus criceti]EHI74064.1 chorismate mutase [Streptococcus criceti HS-6]SUN42955.1 chorismate mutase [Streptococcus criceti]